jgi:hypothetical protein
MQLEAEPVCDNPVPRKPSLQEQVFTLLLTLHDALPGQASMAAHASKTEQFLPSPKKPALHLHATSSVSAEPTQVAFSWHKR